MRYENTVQWAVAAQLGEVYRGCATATTIETLIERLQGPLKSWLDIDVITLALTQEPSVVVASDYPLSQRLAERIQAHGARCIEGTGKAVRSPEDVIIQQVGTVRQVDPIDAETGILWTGALESGGRLTAVVTFYRAQSHQVSPLELTALRQIRSLISDTLVRIIETNIVTDGPDAGRESKKDTQSEISVIGIKDSKLIAQAFGPERVRCIQNEMIGRLSSAHPGAFLIARLGFDRIIIIDHPGNGMTIDAWTKTCNRACQEIDIGPGVHLEISVEIGEVESCSATAPDKTVSKAPTIESPTDVGLDVLAG